jgi:type II secretory pathway component PulF
MLLYQYVAHNPTLTGEKIKATVEAENETEAAKAITETGASPQLILNLIVPAGAWGLW